jgi:anti-sigma factor RsiW
MLTCPQVHPRIALYLDREVTGAEALAFEAHLTECASCRREHDALRATVDAVRGAAPLYDPPEHSHDAVAALVGHWDRGQRQRRWGALAAAATVLLAVAILWSAAGRSGYEKFATESHLAYARGAFPLDVVSNQPQVVSQWLEPRVPFHLTLPNYPDGGPKPYSLSGARLMQFRGEEVAYLAYEMDRKPISLLISSSGRIQPMHGESYRSGGLTFYFSSQDGLRVITWRDKGLVYAQVSDLDVKGAESCGICHGGAGERRKFEGLGKRL